MMKDKIILENIRNFITIKFYDIFRLVLQKDDKTVRVDSLLAND